MKGSPIKEDSDWGPAVKRGPLYEIITGLTLGIAGGDMFMMMHPEAGAAVKRITGMLFGTDTDTEAGAKNIDIDIEDWVKWKE